jgi:predicted RNA-binding protein with PUA-like domain
MGVCRNQEGQEITMSRRYWLMKSDPETFGWDDLKAAPGRRTTWDGVRNYQARNYLRDDVQRGDGVLFYHSGADKAVVGTCRVSKAGFPDPSDAVWTAVELSLERAFARPVTLEAMRHEPGLRGMVLLKRGSRLSIQPVTESEWETVLKLEQSA